MNFNKIDKKVKKMAKKEMEKPVLLVICGLMT